MRILSGSEAGVVKGLISEIEIRPFYYNRNKR
jgi:hypothetical protein